MSKTRLIQACSGVVLALGIATSAEAQFQPGLTIDLRLADGMKFLDPSNWPPGTAIPINVYAVVMGEGPGVEGFQSMQGAFLGTRNPASSGPSGQIVPAGDVGEADFETVVPALSPWTASGAQRGASKLIGAPDRVLDLGDEVARGDDLGDLVVFRSPGMQVTSGTLINGGQGREFHIGRIGFVLGVGFLDEANDDILINWAFRRAADGGPRAEAALFRYDENNPADGRDKIHVGAPIVIPGWIPEPAAIGILATCALWSATRRRKVRLAQS